MTVEGYPIEKGVLSKGEEGGNNDYKLQEGGESRWPLKSKTKYQVQSGGRRILKKERQLGKMWTKESRN